MHGERIAIGHFAIPVANVDGRITILEMVAEDYMVIAEYADAGGIDKIIAIHYAMVTVPQRKLGGAISNGIIPDGNCRGFYRDHFILALALFKQIIFNNTIARRKTV